MRYIDDVIAIILGTLGECDDVDGDVLWGKAPGSKCWWPCREVNPIPFAGKQAKKPKMAAKDARFVVFYDTTRTWQWLSAKNVRPFVSGSAMEKGNWKNSATFLAGVQRAKRDAELHRKMSSGFRFSTLTPEVRVERKKK